MDILSSWMHLKELAGEDNGPIPKPFLLMALSGCTGMDIVSILRKAQATIDNFEMKVSGEISKQQPIVYTAIHIVYEFKGPAENEDLALKAVTDSQEKYCGISSMLKKILPVTWEVFYNGNRIFSNKLEAVPKLIEPLRIIYDWNPWVELLANTN